MSDKNHVPKDSSKKAPKRRPGRDPVTENAPPTHTPPEESRVTPVEVVDVESGIKARAESHETSASFAEETIPTNDAMEADRAQIEINFTGSELLRAKFPKPFDVAEKIATDWVNDGRFEGLPLGHPLAEYFAAKGLRKAKEVEKKVMESPVTEKIAMNVLTYGMKAQEMIHQLKAKVKK